MHYRLSKLPLLLAVSSTVDCAHKGMHRRSLKCESMPRRSLKCEPMPPKCEPMHRRSLKCESMPLKQQYKGRTRVAKPWAISCAAQSLLLRPRTLAATFCDTGSRPWRVSPWSQEMAHVAHKQAETAVVALIQRFVPAIFLQKHKSNRLVNSALEASAT